jgi:hypothetical protein
MIVITMYIHLDLMSAHANSLSRTHLRFATSKVNRVTEHERCTHAPALAHGFAIKRNTLLLTELTESICMQSY